MGAINTLPTVQLHGGVTLTFPAVTCRTFPLRTWGKYGNVPLHKIHTFTKFDGRSPFRHTSRDNIARVQSQRTGQTWTCTPRHQLPSKLCLVRLGHREDFLRTFFCPLWSLYLKWPLCIRGTNVLLVLRSFANFHKYLMKRAMSVKQIALVCSGPILSSNVLNACIGRVAYVSTLISLQQHGQIHPN